jgi:hypothetical protein
MACIPASGAPKSARNGHKSFMRTIDWNILCHNIFPQTNQEVFSDQYVARLMWHAREA